MGKHVRETREIIDWVRKHQHSEKWDDVAMLASEGYDLAVAVAAEVARQVHREVCYLAPAIICREGVPADEFSSEDRHDPRASAVRLGVTIADSLRWMKLPPHCIVEAGRVQRVTFFRRDPCHQTSLVVKIMVPDAPAFCVVASLEGAEHV